MRWNAFGFCLVAVLLLPAPAAKAAFPGSNGEIAFVTFRSVVADAPVQVDPPHLFAIQPDGRGERPLHTGWRVPAYSLGDTGPVWSPDGRRLAYASDEETGLGYPAIYVMNADGSGQRRLTPLLRTALSPSWSPDGRQILFSVLQRGRWDLYAVDPDGGSERRLTRLQSQVEVDGAWSPDGREIALTFGDRVPDIGVIDAEGRGPPVNLTRTSDVEIAPDWSPDGRQLAFSTFSFASGRWDVHVMNRDGSNRAGLTQRVGEGAGAPVWSPDGGHIAFTALAGENQDIFTLDRATGDVRRVTTHPAVDTRPDWQPLPRAAAPASPPARRPLRIVVRGVPADCARRAFRISVTVRGAGQPTRLVVALDGRTLRRASRGRLAVRIPAERLRPGRHRIGVRAEDAAGGRAGRTIAFRRCR